jgi:alanine racemase
MRFEIKEAKNSCTIVTDIGKMEIDTFQEAFTVIKMQQHQPRKSIILLDKNHNENYFAAVARLLAENQINRIIGIGEAISAHAGVFKAKKTFYNTVSQFLEDYHEKMFDQEAILIKGEDIEELKLLSVFLESKSHRTVLEISLDALRYNLDFFRSKLLTGVKTLVMVKAFSYGSGCYEVANLMNCAGVDYLGVAYVDEGVALRNAGITMPILVLNSAIQNLEILLHYQLEPEIFNFRILKSYTETVKRLNIQPMPIHIKIETGMNRLGFRRENIEELVDFLKQNNFIKVKSIFSHLSCSDSPVDDDFTRNQIKKFAEMSNYIISSLNDPTIMRHICNSAGIERFPEAHFDMVRLGIGLYGITANNAKLKHISTLKAIISQIKKVPKEEPVGYSQKGKLDRDSVIGIISIGYADGFNRKFSNRVGQVVVNGQKVPVIGNVCMDMCMIDLTDVEAKEGDEAIIFGEEHPISLLAEQLGTIPYEVLTSIGRRVKYVYIKK